MSTVINNPGNGEGSDNAVGMIIGVVVLIVVIALFFVYVLPMIRDNNPTPSGTNINVTLPAGSNSGTQ